MFQQIVLRTIINNFQQSLNCSCFIRYLYFGLEDSMECLLVKMGPLYFIDKIQYRKMSFLATQKSIFGKSYNTTKCLGLKIA